MENQVKYAESTGSEKAVSESFSLVVDRHVAFGALATVRIAAQPARRFTLQEAAIVARALTAVASGASKERQIYMSPIASDCDFDARAGEDGLVIMREGFEDAQLDWPATRSLAAHLAQAARANS